MKLSIKTRFEIAIAAMTAAMGWMIWEGYYVVVLRLFHYLTTGTAFTKFVYQHGDSLRGMDHYQCFIAKMFLIGTVFSASLFPVIGALFYTTDLGSKLKKRVFAAFSFALCVVPFSALGLAVIFILRCIVGMGPTPRRMMVLGCGLLGMLVIGAFCYWIARIPRKKEGCGAVPL